MTTDGRRRGRRRRRRGREHGVSSRRRRRRPCRPARARGQRSATGSTGACAGGFRHQFSSRINIELSLASVPMILGFTEEHGLPLDVVQDGYLFLVRDEQTGRDFGDGAELQRSLGVDTQLLTAEEAVAARARASRSTTSWARRSAPTTASPIRPGSTQGYATLARRSGADVAAGCRGRRRSSRTARPSPASARSDGIDLRAGRGERGGAVGRDARGDRGRRSFRWNPSRAWS